MSARSYTPCAETIVWLDRSSYPRWIHVPLGLGAVAVIAIAAYVEPISAVPVALIFSFVGACLALVGYLTPLAVALEEQALVVVRERMFTPRPKVLRVPFTEIVCVSRQWRKGGDVGLLVHTRSARRIPLDLVLGSYRIQLNRSEVELVDGPRDPGLLVDALCGVLRARGVTIGLPPSWLARLRARFSGEVARVREESPSKPREPFIEPRWLSLLRASAALTIPLALALMFCVPRLGSSVPSSHESHAVKYRGRAPVYVSEALGAAHDAALPIALTLLIAAATADWRLRRAHYRRGQK